MDVRIGHPHSIFGLVGLTALALSCGSTSSPPSSGSPSPAHWVITAEVDDAGHLRVLDTTRVEAPLKRARRIPSPTLRSLSVERDGAILVEQPVPDEPAIRAELVAPDGTLQSFATPKAPHVITLRLPDDGGATGFSLHSRVKDAPDRDWREADRLELRGAR